MTRRKVVHLLRRFEFVEGRSEARLQAWIDAALLDCGVASEEVASKRCELSFALMELARSEESEILALSFLQGHGVEAVRLTNAARLRHRAREALQRYLASHGYNADDDVRDSCEGPLSDLWGTGKPVRVFAGESGQGKSWAMWRTASVLAEGGSLVVAVDAAGSVDSDLARAASTFCHQVWGIDRAFPLVRLRERVARLCPGSQMPWLTLFVDGVHRHEHADELLCTDWEAMGVRVAFTFAEGEQLGHDARRGIVRVTDFTLEELTRYLQRRLGQAWANVPEDVRETLRRPLLARIYCKLFEGAPDWRPTNEYEFYSRYWGQAAREAAVATDALGRLAVRTLDGLSPPWPVSAATDAGLDQGELDQLARLGLIRQATEGRSIELWHDRILNWAVAEGVVAGLRARRIDEARLCEHVRQCLRSASLGYVVMDLFWLLTDPLSGVHECVPRLLELLEQDFTTRGALTLLPTLGDRILPAAFQRLRDLSAQPDSLTVREYIRVVAAVGTPAVPERAQEFLSTSDVGLQRIATQILTKCPTPDALDRLWELRCALPDDDDHWRELRENTAALASCVELDHEWLRRAIQRAVPEEPVHELAYRLANLSNGRVLWTQLKQQLFAKVSPEKERCLAVCIGQFEDKEEVVWLETRLGREQDFIGALALQALYRVEPDRAVSMADRVPLKHLDLGRNWTVGAMLDLSAEAALDKLEAMIGGARSPWEAARVLGGRANAVSPAILDILLDALELGLERELSTPDASASHPLYWPLSWLASIWRLDLLCCLERRRESLLEERLTQWLLRRGPREGIYARHEESHALTVLYKIGGNGFTQVVNSYLGAESRFGRMDGLEAAAKRPDEETVRLLVGITEREELWNPEAGKPFPVEQVQAITALAEMWKWDVVVRGMLEWGWFLPPEFALYAEGHSFTDCELSPALDALQAGKGDVGAVLALGVSGRQEFLPRVLSALRGSGQDSDLRRACLIALRDLPARSAETEDLFIEHLNNASTRYIAWTALLQFRTERSKKALLACLRRDTKVRSDADWLLGLNLLQQESTREEAARLLWDNADAFHLTWRFGSRLDLFACLQDRAVADTLREIAFADRRRGLAEGVNISAMRGLASFDGPAAWLAAR